MSNQEQPIFDQQWKDACIKWHGKILTGNYAHYCYEWDGLPIDETCGEFTVCNCYPEVVNERNKTQLK